MKIICFKGKSNTGKSTIIGGILNNFFKIKLIQTKKDFTITFMYNNQRIGICSDGDAPIILEKLEKLKKDGCDIIICASRMRGELLKGIKEMTAHENIEYIICNGNYKDEEKIDLFIKIFAKFSE